MNNTSLTSSEQSHDNLPVHDRTSPVLSPENCAPEPKRARILKACDVCRRRKVRCNGDPVRCQQCTHLGLRCVYSVSSKPRGPQGKRGHIISEYRSPTNSVQNPPPILPSINQIVQPSPFNADFFHSLVPDYMEHIYPVQPVIAEKELRDFIVSLDSVDVDPEIKSFLYAFGGCTLNLTRYGERRTEEVVRTIEALSNMSIEGRPCATPYLRGSVLGAMQSMFLHNW